MESRIALSYYSLPSSYLSALEAKAGGTVQNLVISTLRGHSSRHILGQLANLKADTIFVPVPESDWAAFLPMLRLIAQIPRPRRVVICDEALAFTDDHLWNMIPLLAGILLRTVAALALTLVQFLRLRHLIAAPRQNCGLPDDAEHVLYIKSNLWAGVTAGGSISHTSGVISALTSLGKSVTYVSPGNAPELASIRDTICHRVSIRGGFVYPRELNSFIYNWTLSRWTAQISRRSFSFVYHRLSLSSFAAVVVARRLGIPLVVEYNGSEVWINRNWGTPLKLERLAIMAETAVLRHAHLVVTVSDPLRQDLIARGVEPERIVCYPNGYDESLFDPGRFSPADIAAIRAERNIAADAVVATFVGTFGMWHGADVLAKALILLKQERPDWLKHSRLHVVFVGDGVNRPNVEEILAGHGLEDHYTFTGLVSPTQAPCYLAASDFFVAPHVPNPDGSAFFGSPTKLFEYMGMGRPVLASDLAQIGEVLAGSPRLADFPEQDLPASPEQCGLLLTPGDAMELAMGLVQITNHPAWRKSAGYNARLRALDRYTWHHHVGAILHGLDQAVPVVATRKAPHLLALVNAVHSKSGGGLTYLRNLLPLLAREMDIHVVVQTDQEQDVRPLCDQSGLPLHVIPTWEKLSTVLIQEQISIPLLARRIGARLVFSPANYGPVLARNSVILMRNAFEVTSLERRWGKQAYWFAVKLLTQICFATCRRAIVVSDHAAKTFLTVFHLDSDPRLSVVHHGVSPLFHPPASDESRDPTLLLAVSDIYVQKNFETLLRALARLRSSHPGLRLGIAGNELDPAYAESLRTLCRELKITDQVTFLGSQPPDQIARLYREAMVFVFPSLVETFGNPLVEAMASGIPVVCTHAAAMPEVTGGAALLARPRDDAHMAEQIARLLDDRDLWREMSAKGLERAKNFSWEKTAERTAAVLREAAED